MIKAILLIALITTPLYAMKKCKSTPLTAPLLDNSESSIPRISSYENFQELWANFSEEDFQKEVWNEGLENIHNTQFSHDQKVSAGHLQPELIFDIKQTSEENFAERYYQMIGQEMRKCNERKKLNSSFKETPNQPIVDIIRLIQRKNASTPPHIDFCTNKKIMQFCLSGKGDKIAIATKTHDIKVWQINFRHGLAWCVAQKCLGYIPNAMHFDWSETFLATNRNPGDRYEYTQVSQQKPLITLLARATQILNTY